MWVSIKTGLGVAANQVTNPVPIYSPRIPAPYRFCPEAFQWHPPGSEPGFPPGSCQPGYHPP